MGPPGGAANSDVNGGLGTVLDVGLLEARADSETSRSFAIWEIGAMLLSMSRGSTRPVHCLLALGGVSGQLLEAAEHESDLLSHPCIGLEHLKFGCLTLQVRIASRMGFVNGYRSVCRGGGGDHAVPVRRCAVGGSSGGC